MQLGISSYTYTWAIGVPGYPPERSLDAVGLLRKAVALGVGLAQIADNLPLHQLLPAELKRLEQAARDLDVAIEVGTRGIAPGHLFAYLDLALRLGSPIVRVVVDTAEHQPSGHRKPRPVPRPVVGANDRADRQPECGHLPGHGQFLWRFGGTRGGRDRVGTARGQPARQRL